MEDYKVVYETTDGLRSLIDWTTEKKARKEYERLKADTDCYWAELIYSPLHDDSIDEEQVIVGFIRRSVVIMGKTLWLEAKEY